MEVGYPHHDFPTLTAHHLRDAQLYADRIDLLRALPLPAGGIIGEVGVATGALSAFLIDQFRPVQFVAFDLFNLHTIPTLWGQRTSTLFAGKTHLDFYQDRFAAHRGTVVTEQGFSHETLAKYPDDHFDLLYIDADHTHAGVERDSVVARRKLKTSGILVFNDYIMFDHLTNAPYGVVPVVNDLVVNEGWVVIGFALQQHMFCDIAIRRRSA